MRKQIINIEKYWTIYIIYNINLWDKDTGFTRTNMRNRTSVVVIGKADSKEEFLNTIIHEAKHVQSHICEYYNVPEDGEQAAYLIGYIVMKMFRAFKHYL